MSNKYFTTLLWALSISSLAAMLSGCSEKVVLPVAHRADKVIYPDYKAPEDANISLLVPNEIPIYMSGLSAMLTFRLVNLGEKDLDVREWFMDDVNNIRIYYREIDESGKPISETWLTDITAPAQEQRRNRLVLKPYNAAFIEKPLPFIEEIRPGTTKYFEAYGELTHKTLHAKTKVFRLIAN